jgi:hypothetical protein
MSKFKNTPVTGLNELVIDGRTKKIQWKKYDENWWWRNDFGEEPDYEALDSAIEHYPYPVTSYIYEHEKQLTVHSSIVLPHSEIMKRMHNYDSHPEKFNTWTSGFTFNCRIIKKEKKSDKSKELLELLHSYMRGEILDDWNAPPDPTDAMQYLLDYKKKYGLHHD